MLYSQRPDRMYGSYRQTGVERKSDWTHYVFTMHVVGVEKLFLFFCKKKTNFQHLINSKNTFTFKLNTKLFLALN